MSKNYFLNSLFFSMALASNPLLADGESETLLSPKTTKSPFLDERPYDEQYPPNPPFTLPWLTGPLLAPSGHVVPFGHVNMEPYFFANLDNGTYDSHWKPHNSPNFWNLNTQVPVWFGFANNWDFTFSPQFSWNHTHGASHWAYNDLPFAFEYQLLNDKPGTDWRPAIKLAFKASVPFGKYQKLDPNDLGTDAGGSGSWDPGLGLVFSRLFHYTGVHFLAARLAFSYVVPNSVHVKGLNAYGGGHHTHGTVYPGPSFSTDIGLEYTLAQKWALALDLLYDHNNHTRFKGHKGSTGGVPNSIGRPSSEQFSIAPGFEYNWNANCGLIAGVWFSVAGRNASEFITGIIAVNIYQ